MFDVAVVGLGPAGRALASACAARGLRVLAVDARSADARWAPTYGMWADQLGDLPSAVVRTRSEAPALRAHGDHRIERPYVVLDNAALQAALPLDGVVLRRARLDDRGVTRLRGEARTVVDARGARPAGVVADDPSPAQTAYGIIVDADVAAAALGGADGVLMDWRTDWALDPARARGVPSFLYAFGLGDGRVLLEETCLAAAPGMAIAELATRLERRLRRLGVDVGAVASASGREVVRIPMLGRDARPPRGALAFGTAGRGGHPVTGYSVAHSLRMADMLADVLAGREVARHSGNFPSRAERTAPLGKFPECRRTGPPHDPVGDVLRGLGLRAVLHLDVAGTLDLFDAFGRLPAPLQAAYLDRDAHAGAVAAAMWGMFTRMDAAGRLRLALASAGIRPDVGR